MVYTIQINIVSTFEKEFETKEEADSYGLSEEEINNSLNHGVRDIYVREE
jgi:hypothetical protein